MFSSRMELGIYKICWKTASFQPFSLFYTYTEYSQMDICSHKKCQYRIILSWEIEIIENSM